MKSFKLYKYSLYYRTKQLTAPGGGWRDPSWRREVKERVSACAGCSSLWENEQMAVTHSWKFRFLIVKKNNLLSLKFIFLSFSPHATDITEKAPQILTILYSNVTSIFKTGASIGRSITQHSMENCSLTHPCNRSYRWRRSKRQTRSCPRCWRGPRLPCAPRRRSRRWKTRTSLSLLPSQAPSDDRVNSTFLYVELTKPFIIQQTIHEKALMENTSS